MTEILSSWDALNLLFGWRFDVNMKQWVLDIKLGSDLGRIKPVNEDRGYFQQDFDSQGNNVAICAVADGMGGLEAGERASEIAIQYLYRWWEERVKFLISEYNSMHRRLNEENSNVTMELNENNRQTILQPVPLEKVAHEFDGVFAQINNALILEGRQMGKRIGTTLSVIFIYGQDYVIKHIGDSRIYRVTGRAELLTEDHSWVALQVKKGQLTAEEAKQHPSRHVLTQCLGVNDSISPFLRYGTLQGDELILLCSDGFYTMVDEGQWLKYLEQAKIKSQDLQTTLDKLVALANQNGGHDNITIIIVNGINENKKKTSYISKMIAWFKK